MKHIFVQFVSLVVQRSTHKRKRVKASRFWCLLKFLWFARLLSFMIKYYKESMRDSKLVPSVRYLTLAGRQFNLYPFISSNPKQRTMLSLSYMGPKKRSGGEDTSTWGSVVWRTRWKPVADLQYSYKRCERASPPIRI